MAHLSLKARVTLIKEEHGLDISENTLRNFYRKN